MRLRRLAEVNYLTPYFTNNRMDCQVGGLVSRISNFFNCETAVDTNTQHIQVWRKTCTEV